VADELPDVSFVVGVYTVTRLAKAGLWLVTAQTSHAISRLFWRAQEMYESPNPDFREGAPSLLEYMRWYCEEFSAAKTFTYDTDYVGFNLPAAAARRTMDATLPDPSEYDIAFARVAEGVGARQGGDYYLIGAVEGDRANTEHEISHGMFYLRPAYKAAAVKLVNALPERDELFALLRAEGYSEEVLIDESQAYLATGLFEDLAHLEQVRHPFMQLFAKHRKLLIKPEKARRAEPKLTPPADLGSSPNLK
jgi:hypothetical protein